MFDCSKCRHTEVCKFKEDKFIKIIESLEKEVNELQEKCQNIDIKIECKYLSRIDNVNFR